MNIDREPIQVQIDFFLNMYAAGFLFEEGITTESPVNKGLTGEALDTIMNSPELPRKFCQYLIVQYLGNMRERTLRKSTNKTKN
jgi:hypothetical protein